VSEGIPQWLVVILGGVVPMVAFIGFWMGLSARLTRGELVAEHALKDAAEATAKTVLLETSFSLFREQVAKEYIDRAVMSGVEDRLTLAIDRLGDRLDRIFEKRLNGE